MVRTLAELKAMQQMPGFSASTQATISREIASHEGAASGATRRGGVSGHSGVAAGGRPSAPGQPTPEPTPFTPRAVVDIMRSRIPYAQKLQQIRKLREQQRQFKQPVSLTAKQYAQETSEAKREVGRQVSEYGAMMDGIDPSASYTYQGSTMTGATLKAKLKQEYGKPLREAEQQTQMAWSEARDIEKEAHPKTVITKTDKGYSFKFPYAGAEKYRTYKKTLRRGGIPLGFATALTGADPLGLKSTYYMATGQKEKAKQTKVEALYGVKQAQKGGWKAAEWYVSMPTTQIGLAAVGGEVIGAGTGAVEATKWGTKALLVSRGVTAVGKPLYTVTASSVLKTGMGVGFGGMYVKETAPLVSKAVKTGDWGDVVGTAGVTALALPAGISGYKKGHALGFGRTESYLYGKATYKPGSPEAIRYKSALKVARKLEVVKSHKAEPLDIAKDIMRMDKISASKTVQFLEKYPKTTIGGSAASYTQIEKARLPRDIDLLLKGGDKQILGAKKYFGRLLKTRRGEHRIDIHGEEMFEPGRHVEFGFFSKKPLKISGTRYMKAGEQIFRKAISSVKTETQYRHFKDLPDFITHSRSLIKSAKMKTLTRWRGTSAEKHLETFLDPTKHAKFGKQDVYTRLFGKPKPTPKERVIPISKSGYTPIESVYYRYPGMKRMFPSYYGYLPKKSSYPTYPYYPSSKPSTIKPPPETTHVYRPLDYLLPKFFPKIISPSPKPQSYLPYKPPSPPPTTKIIIPPYVPPEKTTKQHFKPRKIKKPQWDDFPGRRKIQKGTPKMLFPGYKFRKFDVGSLFTGGNL